MPFVPHTPDDERRMLASIGASEIEDLFDEIPPHLRANKLEHVPPGIPEMALLRLMNERARQDEIDLCFIGAGAYEHHIPAAIWDLVQRGEFMTAYTPYQAEASQGTLQLIYEFQTMISRLTGMEVANASVYDGASAMAEAILMAVRANKKVKSREVLCAGNLHPRYLSASGAIVGNQGISLDVLPYDDATGQAEVALPDGDFAAIVISMPNFFGGIDDVDALVNAAHARNMLVIAVVNPTSLALLKPPGQWGDDGADIAVGEGQPLGIPLASGGPYAGFMCCRKSLVRQMPGRIIGRTVDTEDRVGYALTLQAREQHIRRAKATSNICTNQGLLVTAATIYMSLMGDAGLRQVALASHQGLSHLAEKLTSLTGVSRRFSAPVFHEAVLALPVPAATFLEGMADAGILAGYDLGEVDAALVNCVLVNVTETKTQADLDRYVTTANEVLA